MSTSTTTSKKCNKCEVVKASTEFYNRTESTDTYRICKKCHSHYVNAVKKLKRKFRGIIEARSLKIDHDLGLGECWEWRGASHKSGYGRIYFNTKSVLYTHRASYWAFSGLIPKGALVLHRCNNKICCNPKHLYLGDHKQNAIDALDDESNGYPRKLTDEDVWYIRSQRQYRGLFVSLAEELNVNPGTIAHCYNYISWKHI